MKKIIKFFCLFLIAVFTISIPQTVKATEKSEDGKFEYEANYYEGTCEITRYHGDLSKVVFPSKLDGLKVTAVNCYFDTEYEKDRRSYWAHIGTIVLPKGIEEFSLKTYEELNNGYFKYYHYTLNKISFPDGIKNIDIPLNASEAYSSFEKITIPVGVEKLSIANDDLKSVKFEKGTKEVPSYAFKGCCSLEKVTLPSSVKVIGEGAFEWCEKLEKIDINNVEEIQECAFSHSESLKSVTFNKKKLSIGSSAFSYSGLEKVTVPACAKVGYSVFNDCFNLKELVVKTNSIEEVNIVERCGKLEKFSIPTSATYINFDCAELYSLKQLVIPSSVTKIDTLNRLGMAKNSKLYILNPNCQLNSRYDKELTASTVIYGYKDSTAQEYAKEHGHKFIALTTVKNLKATNPSKNTAKISWNKVKGVKEYTIYRSTSKDSGYKKVATVKTNTYTDKKVSKGKTYYYKICINYEDKNGVQLKGIESATKSVKITK